MFPYRRHPAPLPPEFETPALGTYTELLAPVSLVTVARGREVFSDSRRLFARLEEIAAALKAAPAERAIMAVWQGGRHVSEEGVAALEAMLATCGLTAFNRACKRRTGPECALGTKYQWSFISEYLGWNWERA